MTPKFYYLLKFDVVYEQGNKKYQVKLIEIIIYTTLYIMFK